MNLSRISSPVLRRAANPVIETLEKRQLLSLTVDLRLPGGAKSANVASVGQVIGMEVWATVKGANASGSDEALQIVVGSLLSTNLSGGAANGTLKVTRITPFNDSGSQNGIQRDLDGDGDLDIGSNVVDDGSDFFAARAGEMISAGTVSGNSKSFKIATATFTVTSLKSTTGQTNLVFRPRTSGTGGIWEEDGNIKRESTGSYSAGAPLVLRRGGATSGGSISGNVFQDADKDNVKDAGESGFSGVTMYLDADKDGVKDTGEKTAVTDSAGDYYFTGLAAGSYRVRQVVPGGWSIGSPAGGYHDVTLTTNQNVGGKNFADRSTTTATGGRISGILYSDTDKDGVLDTGETRLGGKKMFLDSNKNGKLDTGEKTATTSSSGEYVFSGLSAGSYRVRRSDTPTGYGFSTPSSGYYDITLASNQQVSGKNFGAIPITNTGTGARISGIVFSDGDKDGVLDAADTRLGGKKMYIDANKNGKFDTGEKTATTSSTGEYVFSGLVAGSYRVRRADLPAGYKYSTPTSGYYDIVLGTNQQVSGKHFGAVLA